MTATRRLWLPVLALAALAADLGRLHALEHGDSIVPVLVSLQRWTPMYWDQERYGMLVPLLALPFRDPLANLLVQRGLLLLGGLASVALLARYTLGRALGFTVGLAAAGTLLALLPAPWLFEYLGDQPYGVSAALCLWGLLLAEGGGRRRGAGGLLLCLLGHWVNAAAGLFLGPVVLARWAVGEPPGGGEGAGPARAGARTLRALLVPLGLLAAGLLLGQACIWLYPALSGHPLRLDTGAWPLVRWPGALLALLRSGLQGAGPWPAFAVAAAGLGLLLPWPLRPGEAPGPRRRALVRAAALVLAALAYAQATAALRWVAANRYHWRYLAPSLVLAHVAALSLLGEPLTRLRALARPARAAALLLPLVGALVAFGPPSPRVVRDDLDRTLGRWTEDVLAARCDLVAGDYWTVWPAVWHAGWVARTRGLPGPYGITHRTNPTVRFWSARPREGLRICRVRGAEEEAERWLRAFHLWPVRELERRATVDVLAPAGARM